MKIVLLKDVKVKDVNGKDVLRSTVRFSRGIAYEWRKGTQMEVSDATGQKMIKAGDAAEVKANVVAASK